MSKLLDQINQPNDIKKIPLEEYPLLAQEIRDFLIDSVSRTGGHLASNLGAVELTLALHSVLTFPEDKIVWDVGHQAYTHKILTGRKEQFDQLRQLDGMSGFPKRHESDCDSFDTGHSSTSISAALGIAAANQLDKNPGKVVAVIGDGALTGGMALEALNHVASLKRNFVIILNDNNMSISKNVGSLSNYLNKLRVGEHYNDFKNDLEESLNKIPKVGNRILKRMKRTKDNIRNIIFQGSLFNDLGITYIGPIDGHDVMQMEAIFNDALKIDHPIVIHVKTIKGKGYKYAEKNPSKFHGINPFDKKTGEEINAGNAMTYTDIFSKTIVELAKTDEKIVTITAAMPDGTGLSAFAKKYPDRFFDVGIAEEHAVTFAAGLASRGYKPFISIYSSFYQRAYDQILHDVCLQNLPVKFIFDRAGLVGKDGETHQGIFDISFLSAMPNMTIIAPKDTKELVDAIRYAAEFDGPIAIRFSRGTAYAGLIEEQKDFVPKKSQILRTGEKVALIAVGNMVEEAQKAVELLQEKDIHVTFVNARFLKPLDTDCIDRLAEKHSHLIIVEEAIKKGGYGESVEIYAAENQLDLSVDVMAINDSFVEQGEVRALREKIGLSDKDIYKKVLDLMK